MSENSNYAIIKTGGHQYKVQEGDVIKVAKIAGEAGDSVQFDQVLAVSNGADLQLGTPSLSGVTVSGSIIDQCKDAKVIAYKKKRRKGFHWKKGHRQQKTAIRIEALG